MITKKILYRTSHKTRDIHIIRCMSIMTFGLGIHWQFKYDIKKHCKKNYILLLKIHAMLLTF